MCGIVVGLAFGKLNKRDEEVRQRLLRYFTTELLIATEERGKDATGAALLFDDGKFMGLKRGEASSDFLATFGETKDYYGSLLKVWREHESRGRVYLGHCRAATIGDKEDNENNHPIKIGNLVGIHNGKIDNHRKIFEKLKCKRDGEVDSEAIFRLFDYYTNHGKEPFTMDMIQEVVKRLDGQFAVTMFNADNIEQVPVFRDGRPVEFILLRPLGILLIVSEDKYWDRIHYRYERILFYFPELIGMRLPSFLDDGCVETATLPDDHAMLFDLSKKVTMETKIEDLGEKKRLERTKLSDWKTAYTTTTYAGGHYSSKVTTPNRSTTPTVSKTDSGARRVFDKIKKQYVIKSGDKELNDEESATLDADTNEVKIDKPEESKPKNEEKPKSVEKEGKDKEETSDPVKVDDRTDYEKQEDIIDVPAKDIEVVETRPQIVEVMMTKFPTEAVTAANNAYKDLPEDKKGYSDVNDALADIEVKDEARAMKLGIHIVANRVAKVKWIEGCMAGYALAMQDDDKDEKSRSREKHIANLKMMTVLLSKFFNRLYAEDKNNKEKLASVVLNSKYTPDIEDVSKVFNSYELGLVKDVMDILTNAEVYKSAEKKKAAGAKEEEK